MAQLSRSVASLRIFGDTLDPDEISCLLGGAATESFRKGEVKPSKVREVIRKSGGWLLQATDRKPEDLNAQVEEILGQLTEDLAVWAQLASQYKVDLFCGFFMSESDGGLELSAKTLRALGDRGIKIGVCIYGPIDDEP